MKHDYSWLLSYAEILKDKVILELGCGSGLDTAVLSTYTDTLVSGDLAPNPEIEGSVLVLDHAKALPFEDASFDVVVASLCLHYFKIEKTKEIVAEIARVLKPQGSLIGRLNSYKDENYGAVGFPEIEPGLYDVNGEQKRFFKEQEIQSLLAQDYSITNISHKEIDRYQKAKWIYEFRAIRV